MSKIFRVLLFLSALVPSEKIFATESYKNFKSLTFEENSVLSSSDRFVITSLENADLLFTDLGTDKQKILPLPERIHDFQTDDEKGLLFYTDNDRVLHIADIQDTHFNQSLGLSSLCPDESGSVAAFYKGDAPLVAVSGQMKGALLIWNYITGYLAQNVISLGDDQLCHVEKIHWSKDGKKMACEYRTLDSAGVTAIIDTADKKNSKLVKKIVAPAITHMLLDAGVVLHTDAYDSSDIMVSSVDAHVKDAVLKTGGAVSFPFAEHPFYTHHISMVRLRDKQLQTWNVHTKELLQTCNIPAFAGTLKHIAYKDGVHTTAFIATRSQRLPDNSYDHTIALYKDTGELIKTFDGADSYQISSSGKKIVSRINGNFEVYDVAKMLKELKK